MRGAIIRWTIYLTALLAAGPLAGRTTAWLRAPDGGTHATPLLSNEPGLGVAAALGAVGIALAMGVLGGRLLGVKAGMSTAGLVLAWAAWRTGTIDQVFRSYHSPGILWKLAVEGLIFGAAGVAAVLLIAFLGIHDEQGKDAPAEPPIPLWSFAPLPIAAGVVAGALAAWLVAQEPLKGQAVAAAIVGALVAAAAARLVDYRAPIATLAVPVAVLAVLGPLSAAVFGGSGGGGVVQAGRNGALFPLANILPLDWIAGGLLGIPLGVAWAGSLLDKRSDPKA